MTNLLIAQTFLTSCIAAWMFAAVLNNWLRPALNLEAVAAVMRMDLFAQDYPNDFTHVRHRAIHRPALHRLVFGCIVISETLATLTLLAGAILLWSALVFGADPELARTVALGGCLVFVGTWTGFLLGGEYFCYWYGFFNAQATHMLLILWGTVVASLLAVPV